MGTIKHPSGCEEERKNSLLLRFERRYSLLSACSCTLLLSPPLSLCYSHSLHTLSAFTLSFLPYLHQGGKVRAIVISGALIRYTDDSTLPPPPSHPHTTLIVPLFLFLIFFVLLGTDEGRTPHSAVELVHPDRTLLYRVDYVYFQVAPLLCFSPFTLFLFFSLLLLSSRPTFFSFTSSSSHHSLSHSQSIRRVCSVGTLHSLRAAAFPMKKFTPILRCSSYLSFSPFFPPSSLFPFIPPLPLILPHPRCPVRSVS